MKELILCLFFIASCVIAQTTNGGIQYSKFNINNISTFIYNDGRADLKGNDSGFNYPKGSNLAIYYLSGFVWGGKVDGQIRIGGSTFDSGLKAGVVLPSGQPENSLSEDVRVFRVRKDFQTADLSMEAADENKTVQEVFNQYKKDWDEWPAKKGAPFTDVDKNNIYNPSIDIPGEPGADQTLWFAANDFDSIKTKSLYGSLPLGIEMQTTVWGYDESPPLGNNIFKKYLLINKSKNNFTDMYVGLWADPDLGDASDDLVGCDTLLNLGYVYNSRNNDASYAEKNPPASGFCLIEGPHVKGYSYDEAFFRNRKIPGIKNLDMSAFSYIYKSGEPSGLDYVKGTLHFYNLLQGMTKDGVEHPLLEQMGSGTTKFPFSGDPVTGSGFVDGFVRFNDGTGDRPADHRMMVCSGPFNLAVGDTQEIIFAQIAAGADSKTNYLGAVYLLKEYSQYIKNLFRSFGKKQHPLIKPVSHASELDQKILLTWGENDQEVKQVEDSSTIFKFQGYNIYQLPSANSRVSEGKRIATFDIIDNKEKILDYIFDPTTNNSSLKPVQFGSDSGIQRYFLVDRDYLYNKPLANGTGYYYAVSSYYYNHGQVTPNNYESVVGVLKVVPHSSPAGVRYPNSTGDKIPVNHIVGESRASVEVVVIDPSKMNGEQYEISFQNPGTGISFSIKNLSNGKILLASQKNLSGDDDYIVTNGFLVKVKNDSKEPIKEKDTYRFTLPNVIYDSNLASNDLNLINVFPNPFYRRESIYFSDKMEYITFSHLPQKAIIRIFNIAGQLVRKIEKDFADQFVKWDLCNDSMFLIPSGIYIAYIELPDFGKNKILKLVVVQ